MIALRKRLRALYNKHEADPSSFTIEDWDDIAQDSERKVLYIYSEFDRSEWPESVPYPNMIAMRKWQTAEVASLEKEKDRLLEKHEAEMAGLQKQGDKLRRELTERKRVYGLLKVLIDRVNAEGEASVSLKEWEDAMEGTGAWFQNASITGAVQRARDREATENFVEFDEASETSEDDESIEDSQNCGAGEDNEDS
jgi:hypothetical protein